MLGQGDKKEHVELWLSQGAQVDGVAGFAVGRTVFLEPIKALYTKTLSQDEAIDVISQNFLEFYTVFVNAKKGSELQVI